MREETTNTLAVLGLTLIASGFLLTTFLFTSGLVFTYLAVVAIILMLISDLKWGKTKEPIYGYNSKNIPKQLLMGFLAVGIILFIFVGQRGLSMGLPLAVENLDWLRKSFTIIVVAPLTEEPLFRGGIFTLLHNGFYNHERDNKTFATAAAAVATSMVFALYHIAAYGLGETSSYIGAFIFSMTVIYVNVYTKSLLPGQIAHHIINAFLWMQKFAVISI